MSTAAAASFAGPGAAEAGPPPSDDGVSLEEALAECNIMLLLHREHRHPAVCYSAGAMLRRSFRG